MSVRYDTRGKLTLLAEGSGYVMVRRPGAMPFILTSREWQALPDAATPPSWWEVRHGVMGFEPVFTGTRITLVTVQALYTRGYTADDIHGMYPELPLESIRLAMNERKP